MRLRRIALQDFRNIELARLHFDGERHLFTGANAQGKTNLLEGIGYLAALRSFRTPENGLLVRHGRSEAVLVYELEHETFGETRVSVRIGSGGGRRVEWEGDRVARLADVLGKFPSVVFSSGDITFMRGSPGVRRRWADLVFSAVDQSYFLALQQYYRGMASRNALLKRRASGAEVAAFEREMAGAAVALVRKRQTGVRRLNGVLEATYREIGGGGEKAALAYRSVLGGEASEAGLVEKWEEGRERDAVAGTTRSGPHRDDFFLSLDGYSAGKYGSEGQQRSLSVALRFAQMHLVREDTGLLPLVLMDDVAGELDAERRERFWKHMTTGAQVFATGTERPPLPKGEWRFYRVAGGTFSPDPE